MLITNISTNSEKITRRSIQRLGIMVNLATSNITVPQPAWENIMVKAVLNRGGRTITLFHDNLANLAGETMYWHSYEHLSASYAIALAAQEFQYGLFIDLGAPINLQGDDSIDLEIAALSGWYPNNVTQGTIEALWRDVIGVESGIPTIRSKSIPTGVQKFTESLGDNVTRVTILNNEYARLHNNANAVIQSVIMTSDRYNVNDDMKRLLSRRNTQFETLGAAQLRGCTFAYQMDTECDALQIDLTLASANVVASKNTVMWRAMIIDNFTLARAQATQQKHGQRNFQKLVKSGVKQDVAAGAVVAG